MVRRWILKNQIRKKYELSCKYGVDERVRFYRMMFGSGKVIKYLKSCIKEEEKYLKEQTNFWSEGEVKGLIKKL